MTKLFSHLLFIALLAITWASCERVKDPCLLPTTVYGRLGTYKAVENDTGVTITDSLLPNATIGVVDSNRVFYLNQKNINKFLFLLSPKSDSIKMFIIADSAKRSIFDVDTITFYYERKLNFLSTACGYNYFFNLYDYRTTTNVLDSVRINNGNISSDANLEHVKIYY